MVESIPITFKKKFLAGLFVTIPAAITIFVIVSLFRFVDGLLGPVFDDLLGQHTSGLGFIGAVIIVFVIGIISTNVFGKKVLSQVEKLFMNIPVFKSIYSALKQMVDAFLLKTRVPSSSSLSSSIPDRGPIPSVSSQKSVLSKPGQGRGVSRRFIYPPTTSISARSSSSMRGASPIRTYP
ncbi:MAG: DUF502 domain-containing protein [Nitrospirales bacterium]|nr:DUF502 domain-containing protein [Nitrospirales bacterium]